MSLKRLEEKLCLYFSPRTLKTSRLLANGNIKINYTRKKKERKLTIIHKYRPAEFSEPAPAVTTQEEEEKSDDDLFVNNNRPIMSETESESSDEE